MPKTARHSLSAGKGGAMPFSLLTDDVLCEVARGNMPVLFALKATCKDARRVLSNWLRMQVSVRLQVRPS